MNLNPTRNPMTRYGNRSIYRGNPECKQKLSTYVPCKG